MNTSTKQRSPNYPSVDLAAAVADIRTLYQKNGRSRIGMEPAARALGYKGLSGPSRSRIAALRHYGLLDYAGALVAPSDRGLVIAMRSPDSEEYRAALREAAMTPEIFRELSQTHMEASEDALRHYLVAVKKFSPDGARKLAEIFKETMRLVSPVSGSYDQDIPPPLEEVARFDSPASVSGRSASPPLNPQSRVYSWPLSESRSVSVTFEDGLDGEEDLDTLIDYLETVRRSLQRARQRQATELEEEFGAEA